MRRNNRKDLKDLHPLLHAHHRHAHSIKEWYSGLSHLGFYHGLTRYDCFQAGHKKRRYCLTAQRVEQQDSEGGQNIVIFVKLPIVLYL